MRPATEADLLHIYKTMWDRGREELQYLMPPEVWWAAWRQRIKRGDAVSFEHAILGCDRESEGVVATAFQASKSFELPGVGRRVTREMRQAIPRLMEERGIGTVCTYSLCVHPETEKWFRLLGLEEDTSYRGIKRGPYVSRRFIRRA